jgi:hypothetical protein
MRLDFRQQDDEFFHVDSGHCAGRVVALENGKGFSVHRAFTDADERDKIGVVKSMNEALPKLADYYEKNWPKWKRTRKARHHEDGRYTMYTEFAKWSPYGVFNVTQQEDGLWVATRCNDALLHDVMVAAFETSEIARHVADLHEYDGFANYPALNDGYSWDGRPWIVHWAYANG